MARRGRINRQKIQQRADKYISKGKLADAIRELQRLVDDNPGDMNTVNKIGDLYVRLGNTQDAVGQFTRIAESFFEDGFILKSIAIYKKINKLDPSQMGIYQKLADLYLTQGLTMEAKSQYQVIGDHYQKAGKTEEALEIFNKIIELDPTNIKIRARVADIYQKQGDTEKALHEYLVIGHKLVSKGMFKEAIAVFERARRIEPDNNHALRGMAMALASEGRPADAIPMLKAILQKDPGNLDMLELLGKCLMETGSLPEAEKAFAALYEEDRTARERLLELYRAYLRGNEAESAFRCIQKLLPDIIEEGAVDAAINYVKDVLRRDKLYAPALEALAEIYESRDRDVELLATRSQLADAYIRDGEKTKAEAVLRELAEADPMNVKHQERLRSLGGAKPAVKPAAKPAAKPAVKPTAKPPAKPKAPPVSLPEMEMLEFEDEDMVAADESAEQVAEAETAPAEEFVFELPGEEPTVLDASPDASPIEQAEEIEAVEVVEEVFVVEETAEPPAAESEAATPAAATPELVEPAPAEPEQIEFEEFEAPEPVEVEEVAEPEEILEPMALEGLDDEAARFVAEHITEAEVFSKYGLTERAIEQLKAATARYPTVAEPHVRLRELFQDRADAISSATEGLLLVDIYWKQGEADKALDAYKEAQRLAPDHPLLADAASLFEQESGVGEEAVAESAPSVEGAAVPAVEPIGVPDQGADEVVIDDFSGEPQAAEVPEVIGSEEEPFVVVQDEAQASFEEAAASEPEPPAPVVEEVDGLPDPPVPVAEEVDALPEAPVPAVEKPAPPPPRRSRRVSKAEDLLASLEASIRRPAHRGDPIKAVDDLLASLSPKKKTAKPAAMTSKKHSPALPSETEKVAAVPELPAEEIAEVSAELPAEVPAVMPAEENDEVLDEMPPPIEAEIEASEELVDQTLSEVLGESGGLMDYATDLSTDLASLVADAVDDDDAGDSDAGMLGDIFSEFRKGVDEQLADNDYETRYNLGIAYKEMGLVDEAIREFEVAGGDPARSIECCSMIGLCRMEKGDPAGAVEWFRKGLSANNHSKDQLLGLYFDLGSALEAIGNHQGALEAFKQVESKSPDHRNVGERIKKLAALV